MTIQQILRQFWGYDHFRPLQAEAVQAAVQGHDVLVLMPTGGGKSICFQVAALARPGVCLVVTPLVALMHDQVAALRKRGIPAVAIHSGMRWREMDIALDNAIQGAVKFLYVSPERLRTELMIERTKQMDVALLAVDEAHCISAWGYDFRPPYLQIAEFRELLPNVPVVALTASATPDVQTDIVEKLEMRSLDSKSPRIFRTTFARPNLSYSAIQDEAKEARLLTILDKVPGTAIVYVRSRRQTEQVADWLGRQAVAATFYHAGLPARDRLARQDAWLAGQVRVIVATNAFGMGIDKPDVRLVVHLDLPETLEAYYQEAGRAGRDGQRAYAVLLYGPADVQGLPKRLEQQYPPMDLLRRTYQALANYTGVPVGGGQFTPYDFDLPDFARKFNLPTSETHYALRQLQQGGFIDLNEAVEYPARVRLAVDNSQLYEFQVMNPAFDTFLKLLLRIYGGALFSEYVVISENTLARAFLTGTADVVKLLQQLNERGILEYEAAKDKPQVQFLTPRHDAPTLPLDVQTLRLAKQRTLKKGEAVVHYVSQPVQCRTRLLQTYFGEETPADASCGICDNCLKQKKAAAPATDTVAIRDRIRDYVAIGRAEGVSPRQLASYFSTTQADTLADLLRQMLADEELRYNAGGNLTINR